jgi:uncharacterized protein
VRGPVVEHILKGKPTQIGKLKSFDFDRIRLPIPNLPADFINFKLVHLGDTHFDANWNDAWDRLIATMNEFRVDAIAFTGDWVEDKFDFRRGLHCVRRFVEQTKSRLGIFSVLGNHDGDLLAPHLHDLGVHLLVGDHRRIAGASGAIEFVGLPGVSRDDLSDALIDSIPDRPADTVRVVLSHFPDAVRRARRLAPHLFLAGHTHGGQVCLPGGRPMITHDGLPRSMSSGLHEFEGFWFHVTRGLGTSAKAIRVCCPPQCTLFELVLPQTE